MVLDKLEDPIWACQKGETPRQYYFFDKYLSFKEGSFDDFYNELQEQFRKDSENNIEKEFNLPTLSTFKKWASDNRWIKRKKAYQINKIDELRNSLIDLELENLEENVKLKTQIKTKALKNIKQLVTENNTTGYQFNQYIQGVSRLNEDNKLDLGLPTQITEEKIAAEVQENLKVTSKQSVIESVEKEAGDFDERFIGIDKNDSDNPSEPPRDT